MEEQTAGAQADEAASDGASADGSSDGRSDAPAPGVDGLADAARRPGETRASRRARREALLQQPILPEMATVPRPLVVAATFVLCAVLVGAVRTHPVVVAVALAGIGLLLGWGWPRLLGSSSRFGSSLAIGVAGVLAPVVAVLPNGQPVLTLVPVALAGGLGLMFAHQILRRDGRPRLTESIGVSAFGLALVTVGTTWLPLTVDDRAGSLAVAALAAIAVSSLVDLAVGYPKVRPWLLPVGMLLGASAALVTANVLGAPGQATAALAGLLCAAVSQAVRRVCTVLPPLTWFSAQMATAAAGVLLPGIVAYSVALALVG